MRREMLLAALLAAVGASRPATAEETEGWPRDFRQGADVFTVYQPQLDAWNGVQLEGQAAVSLRTGESDATFGVIRFTARTTVNKGARMVTLEDLTITKASFPSAADKAEAYAKRLREKLANAPKLIALDRLEADLAISMAGRKKDALPVRNDPPRILFSSIPALLVHLDGPPIYLPVKGTSLHRVVNTRPLLLRDPAGTHFLSLAGGWLEAGALHGPWRPAKSPSVDLEIARKQAAATGAVDLLQASGTTSPAKVPVIQVATTPTELIVTEGEPSWAPIGGGTELLFVRNTSGHVFKHMRDQATYVLVSGRWFRAPSTNGPWTFVSPGLLPADFTRIPDDSPKENVKAAVPGTAQAEEALIANSIPQTAKVDRQRAQLTPPNYDGEPRLRAIEGTSLHYVVNTSTPIIMVAPHSYYAVEKGVWFAATSLRGPWFVATSVPASIYAIPPASSVHYVTYVRIYDATPTVVYVGYTPGYSGTCVSGGVVVYGTGYAYAPWVGTVWYGPPVTYGFGVSVTYTPWTGWTYAHGFGWNAYAPTAAVTTGNVYSQWGATTAVSRTGGGYNAWTGNAWASQAGTSYNSRTGVASAGQRAGVQNVYTGNYAGAERGVVQGPGGATAGGGRVTVGNAATGQSVTAGRGAVYNPSNGTTTSAAGVHGENGGVARVGNDVYAGRDGNVYKHGSDGWQHYQNGGWQSVGDAERTRSLDEQRSARATGEGRVQGFRQSGASGAGSRPAFGGRRR